MFNHVGYADAPLLWGVCTLINCTSWPSRNSLCITVVFLFVFLFSPSVYAKIMGTSALYSEKGAPYLGFLTYDDSYDSARPGILIFPQAMGISRHERRRAEQLARLGYTVLVADMYGRHLTPSNPSQAAVMARNLKNDRAMMRRRATAALTLLARQKWTDPHLIAAIGYGFGGTVALELARSGANIKGVVSFCGDLDSPTPADAKNIKGSILIIHGADDPFVPWSQLDEFRHEMQQAGCDWQLSVYGNSAHAFTQAQAKDQPVVSGVVYNRLTDGRSFRDMQRFFKEILE